MTKIFVLASMLAFSIPLFGGCAGKGDDEKNRNCRALHKRLELCNMQLEDDQKVMKRQVAAGKESFVSGCRENYTKGRTVKMMECLAKPACKDFLKCIEHRPDNGMNQETDDTMPDHPDRGTKTPTAPSGMPVEEKPATP
ncbi:MAG: hypothetical protein CVU65_03280 [Deltaproteobacteria bacterium HGW-Deltaproteobacteria-22]|nr:MAG: hypothetical protein CVU65_03280 [Deltaproteobacteria bacterium HGW-Deltaproteobacteria-22]